MKIGELAKRTGCPVETIRYYEHQGLLPSPSRNNSNYRLYSQLHFERLTFIRNCRVLDMTLEEIGRLLAMHDRPHASCALISTLVKEHIAHVEARIQNLQALHAQLRELLGRCKGGSEKMAYCGIVLQLSSHSSGSSLSTAEKNELK